jgi:HAD superfamily hydrolase (TIGR01509 family)
MRNKLHFYRGFAFDLEGTCLDLEIYHFLAFELAMSELGCRITVTEIQALPGAVGGGDPFIAALLAVQTSFHHERILEAKLKHFDLLVKDLQIEPRLGVIEVIEELKRGGYPVAIGSLTPRTRGEQLLERSRLGAFFKTDHVVFREDVRQIKPAPDIYRETARRMGIKPYEQVVFEDSVPGVKAGVAAGSKEVVAVPATIFQEEKHVRDLKLAGANRVCKGWHIVHPLLPELVTVGN